MNRKSKQSGTTHPKLPARVGRAARGLTQAAHSGALPGGCLPTFSRRLPGYGVVRETRKIDLQAGDNTVRFSDVASGIDPTTVSFQSLTAPDATSVLEQNYEYDVASADKLLEKYLGRELSISRKSDNA